MRKCIICGKSLAKHNQADVCFCHPEHPDYTPEIEKPSTKCSSPTNVGRTTAMRDYDGIVLDC